MAPGLEWVWDRERRHRGAADARGRSSTTAQTRVSPNAATAVTSQRDEGFWEQAEQWDVSRGTAQTPCAGAPKHAVQAISDLFSCFALVCRDADSQRLEED